MEALSEVTNVGIANNRGASTKETQLYQSLRLLTGASQLITIDSKDAQHGTLSVKLSGYTVFMDDDITVQDDRVAQVLQPFVSFHQGNSARDDALFLQEAALAVECAVKRFDMFQYVEKHFKDMLTREDDVCIDVEDLVINVNSSLALTLRWNILCNSEGQCEHALEIYPSSQKADQLLRLKGADCLYDMSSKFNMLCDQVGYTHAIHITLSALSGR